MKDFKVELTTRGKSFREGKIQRGIFQGGALSLLLFVIAMMLLSHILRKCAGSNKLHRLQEKSYLRVYMDNIKPFAKMEKELETLIQAVRIYSQDIGTEFGIVKCAVLIKRCGKRQIIEETELGIRKGNLEILGNIASGHHQTSGNWPSGKSIRQWPRRPGFNPRSPHTKGFKNGT